MEESREAKLMKNPETDYRRLRQRIEKFSRTRILVLGDIMVDRYFWGAAQRISPEAPVPVVDIDREDQRFGGAANVAHNIRLLGGKVYLCGAVGRDPEGEWLIQNLDHLNIGREGVVLSPDVVTTVKSRVVAHSQQVVRFDRERRGELPRRVMTEVESYLSGIWADIDGVVVSDYGKGLVQESVMARIRSLNRGKGRKVVAVDPKSAHLELYRRTTIITPTLQEALIAAGVRSSPPGSEVNIKNLGAKLLSRTRAGAILITRGEEGMSLFESGREPMHITADAREVYDVTGAGDTVIGTLALALANGSSLRESARLANMAAGVVVSEFGTVPVTKKQLLRALPRRPGL